MKILKTMAFVALVCYAQAAMAQKLNLTDVYIFEIQANTLKTLHSNAVNTSNKTLISRYKADANSLINTIDSVMANNDGLDDKAAASLKKAKNVALNIVK